MSLCRGGVDVSPCRGALLGGTQQRCSVTVSPCHQLVLPSSFASASPTRGHGVGSVAERRGQPQRATVMAWGGSLPLCVCFVGLCKSKIVPVTRLCLLLQGWGGRVGSGQGLGALGLSHPMSHSSAISPLSAGPWVIYCPARCCSPPQEVRLSRQLLGGFRRLVLAPWDVGRCLPYVVTLPLQ